MTYKLLGFLLAAGLIAGSIVAAPPPAQAYPQIITIETFGCLTKIARGKWGEVWIYGQEGWLCGGTALWY